MALTYMIDPTLRLVRFDVGEHAPLLVDLQRALDQLARDALFRPGFGVLANVRDHAVEPGFPRSALTVVAARAAVFGTCRWAQVTTNATVWCTRLMQEQFARDHGLHYRVFRSESTAIAWLLEADAERSKPARRSQWWSSPITPRRPQLL